MGGVGWGWLATLHGMALCAGWRRQGRRTRPGEAGATGAGENVLLLGQHLFIETAAAHASCSPIIDGEPLVRQG